MCYFCVPFVFLNSVVLFFLPFYTASIPIKQQRLKHQIWWFWYETVHYNPVAMITSVPPGRASLTLFSLNTFRLFLVYLAFLRWNPPSAMPFTWNCILSCQHANPSCDTFLVASQLLIIAKIQPCSTVKASGLLTMVAGSLSRSQSGNLMTCHSTCQIKWIKT